MHTLRGHIVVSHWKDYMHISFNRGAQVHPGASASPWSVLGSLRRSAGTALCQPPLHALPISRPSILIFHSHPDSPSRPAYIYTRRSHPALDLSTHTTESLPPIHRCIVIVSDCMASVRVNSRYFRRPGHSSCMCTSVHATEAYTYDTPTVALHDQVRHSGKDRPCLCSMHTACVM